MLRDLQPEEMDDPQLPADVHHHAMIGLARLNRATGVAGAIYRRLRRCSRSLGRPMKVLDIATGSGDMPIAWAKRAARDRLRMDFLGLDISPVAVDFAKQSADRAGVAVQFAQRDVLCDRLPSGFDVVTCGLFIHHLDEPQIVRMLQSMQAAANHAVIVCDLERSAVNVACVWFASHVLTRSGIVHRDGVRSVRASLTRREFQTLASRALDRPVKVEPLPPCRFIATIQESVVRAPEVRLAHAT